MAKSRKAASQPSGDDFRPVFVEQNPWHESGTVPEALAKQIERPLAKYVWQRLRKANPLRFEILLGPRRVGKSTCMYQAVRHLLGADVRPQRLWWLRLDHPLLMNVELGTLVRNVVRSAGATPAQPAYVFLDELTYAKNWDLWLKTFFDEHWPVRLMGSSSATAALRARRQESGVGRWEEQYLAPYVFTEFLDLLGRQPSVPVGASLGQTVAACMEVPVDISGLGPLRRRFLLTGGFPELLVGDPANPADEATTLLHSQRILRADAVERAIYKDIPQSFGVSDPLMLERVLYVLAGQITGILSPNNICSNLGNLSEPTFDRYLSFLERAYLVFTLANFSGSELARQKRGRKLYFVDSAVRNAALQRGIAPLTDAHEMGLLTENLVAAHLHALSQQTQTRVYHWRDGTDEVDLIYDHPAEPLAFEVASSTSHHRRGLRLFMDRFPRFRGRCYLVAPGAPVARPADSPDEIGTVPTDLLLLAIGAQADRELRTRLEG